MKKDNCPPDSLAARFYGKGDAIFNKDNSQAVDEGISRLDAKLHYSAAHALFAAEEESYLKSTNEGFKGWLTGNLSDVTWHPNEILGDDITEGVLEAYDKYAEMVAGEFGRNQMPNELDEKQTAAALKRFRVDAGLTKALVRAEIDANKKFKNDPDRLEYAQSWIHRFRGAGIKGSEIDRVIDGVGGNLARNLLMNNMRAAAQNFFQITTTTLPEYGFEATHKGMQAYRAAVKSNSPELKEAQIGKSRFYEDKYTKYDMFSKPESFNQGVTYFTAKLKALSEGKSQEEAKKIAKNAIQTYQFKHRAGNEPRHYWGSQGKTHLSLLSYGIQMRRLYNDWWKGAYTAVKNKDEKQFREFGRKILYFMGANALLNGITADIPEEVAAALKLFAPNTYKALRTADQFSIFGALDIDTAELARIPVTSAGFVLKVPVLWDKLGDTIQATERMLTHPSAKSFVKVLKEAALLAPPVPIIGNKNIGNITEWVYRSTFGDWDRYTHTGKKYQTDPVTEAKGVLTGQSLRKNIENLGDGKTSSPSGGLGSL